MLRYIVERISDGKFVELEFPIDVSSAGQKLSGAGTFGGTVKPDTGALRTATGDLLADQYASFIHQEIDDQIRGTWLVTRCSFDTPWTIDAAGFSSYIEGEPYEGEFRGVGVDMADVARHIWEHAQRFTRSNIGVTVVGATGVTRGTDSDEKVAAAKKDYDAKKKVLTAAQDKRKAKSAQIKKVAAPFDRRIKELQAEAKPLRETWQTRLDARKPAMEAYKELTKTRTTRTELYKQLVEAKAPAADIAVAKARVEELRDPIAEARAAVDAHKPGIEAAKVPLDAKNAQIKARRAAKELAIADLREEYEDLKSDEEPLKKPVTDAKTVWDAAKERQSADGGAWKILWWDTPDMGQEFQDAIDEAGFEWVEWSGWNSDRTKILKEIRLVKRVGRRQDNLRFVEGENIIDAAVVETPAQEYANTVVAIGAGEGKDALRFSIGTDDGRRRRVHVLDAKNVTRASTLEKLARAELAWRSTPLRVKDIRVDTSHPNSPTGTFGVGDTILIDCNVSWLGRKTLWHRIEEIEWVNETICELTLGVAL